MTFLPIVARELRVASRRRFTYWSRCVTAVGAIIVGIFVYAQSRGEETYILGQYLFNVVSWLAFIYCFGVGVSTSDCLSEEKREGTLGLLFLTDLKGYDVIIGKLFATSLNAFYSLLSIFPVLAIPLLMGGITNGEFWRMALVLANTFLFSLTIGMFISSVSTHPRKAMAATIILLLFFAFGFPLLQSWTSQNNHFPLLNHALMIGPPDAAIFLSSDTNYLTSANDFWLSVGTTHALCWVLLAIASLIVPRSWQDKPSGARVQRWLENWRRWSYGEADERQAFRNRLLDINAFFWLAARARLKPMQVWIVLTGVACLWVWGAAVYSTDWLNGVTYFITAIVLNFTLKIWITSEAGHRLGQDRKIGALELLLSTPISVPEILHGQILALRRQFLGPLLLVLGAEAVMLLASLKAGHPDADEVTISLAFGAAIMFLLVADILALTATAMWISLTTRNPNRTTGIALRRILVLPWLITIVGFFVWELMIYRAQSSNGVWQSFLLLYVAPGVAIDLWLGLGAWRRLQAEFREVAVQRFATPPSIWSRLRGKPYPPAATT